MEWMKLLSKGICNLLIQIMTDPTHYHISERASVVMKRIKELETLDVGY